jgi:hypothetical protein
VSVALQVCHDFFFSFFNYFLFAHH